MILSMIAAMDNNRVIGIDNALPWHLPDDLKHFKAITLGKTIIMGRKTFLSIGKPLPKRRNLVLSRDPEFRSDGIEVFTDLDSALATCREEPEVVIIGGATLYAEALPRAQKLYLTQVDAEVTGDAFFPEFDREDWELSEMQVHPRDDSHTFAFTFLTYLHRT